MSGNALSENSADVNEPSPKNPGANVRTNDPNEKRNEHHAARHPLHRPNDRHTSHDYTASFRVHTVALLSAAYDNVATPVASIRRPPACRL